MATTESLIQIVASLTKAEKRYFSLFANLQVGDKVYWRLYEIIEKHKNKLTDIPEALAKHFPDAILETARKHLYKMLMKSMRNFESNKSIESKLFEKINNVKILFNKGLIDLCFEELERAKNHALKQDNSTCFLILAKLELEYYTLLQFPGVEEEGLVAKQEKINNILHQELYLNNHSSLYQILSFRYSQNGITRSKKENDQLNDLLLEEFRIISNKHYNSIESEKLHLYFQSTYLMMVGNYTESLNLFYQLNLLLNQNVALLSGYPMQYIYLIHGILTNLRQMQKYDDMLIFIDNVKQLKVTSESLRIFIDHVINQHLLARYIDLGKFDEANTLIEKYNCNMNAGINSVPPDFKATMNLLIAINYFSLNQFRIALQYIKDTLNTPSRFISYHIYVLSRLLKVIIHIELKDIDYLKHEIRSMERKLKAKQKLFAIEKITLSFIKKNLNYNFSIADYRQYAQDLTELSLNPFEAHILKWLDLISWSESKISRKAFAETIRKKVSKITKPLEN